MSEQAEKKVQLLSQALENVPFPIDRDTLLEQYGELQLELVHGQVLSLADALCCIEQPCFKSISDLAIAVGENRRDDELHDW